MKKKLALLFISLLLLTSCQTDGISKPKNIELDLWLLDDVTEYDFSSLTLLNYYKFMEMYREMKIPKGLIDNIEN